VPCFKSATSLATVRQLDRPGLLTLHTADGKAYHVLLAALGGDSATLVRGDRRITVPLASLGAAWRGEYGTFWRAPPVFSGSASLVSVGGAGAQWLSDQLARAQPASADRSAPLASRVAAFQVAQGLPPDGLPGPMTLMMLNRATGVDEPRLAAPGAAQGR
jgi:general secretion pathway protein A